MGITLNALNARTRFWLALIILGFLMTGPFLLTATVLLLDMPAAERETLTRVLLHRLPIGFVMTVAGFALGAAILRHLFKQYVEGLHRMAEHLRLMLSANRDFRVIPEGPPEVQELAEAANKLAQQRNELLQDVDQQIAAAKASVENERNRLAALMSELSMGVIVCNLDGRILLYNQRARSQFSAGVASGNACPTLGLGRSVYPLLERKRLQHGLNLIEQRLESGNLHPVTHFVVALKEGRLLHLHMAPVLAGSEETAAAITGYVLTVDDITHRFAQDIQRNHAFHALTAGHRIQLDRISGQSREAEIQQALAEILTQFDRDALTLMDTLKSPWPLEDIPATDLIAALRQGLASHTQLNLKTEAAEESLWIQADSYALIEAVIFLAQRLEEQYGARELSLALHREDAAPGRASLDLVWSGTPMSSETLYSWGLDAVAGGDSLTLRQVVERHGGTLRFLHDSASQRRILRLSLPQAAADAAATARPARIAAGTGRPEYYDFNLFDFRHEGVDLSRKLSALACTVFDTETTGLEPSNGDEIIQIGAVHLLNGRLIAQETFDQLVNPGFPIKPAGIPIHGITDAMVRGQPGIDAVLPNFHDFCADTVLIGHNAAFDMRFLQLKEARSGLRFSQPVLDTLLLSTLIHPGQESHRLEAIAERLGIPLGQRHNALADALMTGQVFLRMLPLLTDKGIVTLGQALEASEKCWHARLKY